MSRSNHSSDKELVMTVLLALFLAPAGFLSQSKNHYVANVTSLETNHSFWLADLFLTSDWVYLFYTRDKKSQSLGLQSRLIEVNGKTDSDFDKPTST